VGHPERSHLHPGALAVSRIARVTSHAGLPSLPWHVPPALVHLGYRVDDAIFLVRYRRSKRALNNYLLVEYLTTGLDIASLLAGLGS
jgi:hypothetical protein